ncbi:MAG: hypothetical protein HY269_05550 [Deltaproteobacteria bacterium]|nr:hypothetical protein [Deltaproteobacteria bacterium]
MAVVADFAEEGWPSMDLVADSLFERLRNEQADRVCPVLVRPSLFFTSQITATPIW